MRYLALDNSTPSQLWEWEGDVDDPVPEPIKRVTIDDVIFMFNEQAAEIERLRQVIHSTTHGACATCNQLQAELTELRRRA